MPILIWFLAIIAIFTFFMLLFGFPSKQRTSKRHWDPDRLGSSRH